MADSTTASPFRASTQTCLNGVVAKYNASSLTEPQQIKDWLGCFDTDANSVLTSGEICSTLNCTAVGMTADQIMSQMDADGDGRVSMSEFDSDLQNSETSNVPPVLGSQSLVGLWMVALVSMASWHL
ncbi:hypothetical protein PSENEW3_00003212 [Picochlorum sp. SENEW3]|nr:hypothetical protein PSENEW3_00003212 [Picochlorum sp. SENEW3]